MLPSSIINKLSSEIKIIFILYKSTFLVHFILQASVLKKKCIYTVNGQLSLQWMIFSNFSEYYFSLSRFFFKSDDESVLIWVMSDDDIVHVDQHALLRLFIDSWNLFRLDFILCDDLQGKCYSLINWLGVFDQTASVNPAKLDWESMRASKHSASGDLTYRSTVFGSCLGILNLYLV